MSPKIVKIGKRRKIGLSKSRKQFFNFNFFGGHFVTKTSFFLIQLKILDFVIPYMTYFKKKNFTSQKGRFSNFATQKPKKDRNATK
jgi:hypothetical protein